MLNYLLAPGADARHPLVDRGIDRITCDVSWWYGKEDWMDKKVDKYVVLSLTIRGIQK